MALNVYNLDIRDLELKSKRLLSGSLMGDYRTKTKGSGFEFDQLRDYQIADDIRFIDWKSSARADKMLVRQYLEDRNRTVILAVDCSASTQYGTGEQTKADLIKQIAAVIAFASYYNKDRVGLILFSDDIELTLPACSSRSQIIALIHQLVSFTAVQKKTDFARAGNYLLHRQRKKALVCILSDFLAPITLSTLTSIAKYHEIVAIRCLDHQELFFPEVSFLTLQDAETGEAALVDTRNLKQSLAAWHSKQQELFKSAGIDFLTLMTNKEFMMPLANFLRKRLRY